MPRMTLADEAILLTRQQSGEHGLLLTFLSDNHGLLRAFKRISSRSAQSLPDLFDEVALGLEKSKTGGDLWFISEYQVRRRRPGIGRNYASLLYACRYGLLLAHHLFEDEESPLWTERLRQALDAWELGERPEVVYLKALYLFARLQGIPAKEEWLPSRSAEEQISARTILSLPVAEQTSERAQVEHLIADFERYLQESHEVHFGTPA